jgi:heat shock protein HtpX
MHGNNNALKTVLLLGVLSAIFLVGGEAIAGRRGLYYGLAFAVFTNFISYFFSDKLALMMSGARPLTPEDFPEAYRRVYPLVERLATRMNLPMPRLYITPEQSPNAFATGRNPQHSALAFTSGILQLMPDDELEGVVAHELGHVLHRDILISSIAATLAAAITALARMTMWFGFGGRDDEERGNPIGAIAMLILAPIAALLIQMAISRTREYDADAASAKYTGNPNQLIAALRKLDTWSQRIPMDANPATQHLYIVQPFTGQSLLRLFSTHPKTEERIRRLEQMAGARYSY